VRRILLVDDDFAQLDMRKSLLECSGHSVRAAFSPFDALRHIATGWPDLLIFDLRMPAAEDGLRLIRDVRESGCLTPIIMLSGWPDDLYERPEAREISRVIVKPAPILDILQAIAEAPAQSLPAQPN
jgi:CheY-like chemotaxis protein